MKNLKTGGGTRMVYLCALVVIFAAVFACTFDPKLHIGGDDSNYYIYATSIVKGSGYSDISNYREPATGAFPPGYPLLMSPVRAVTESIAAQKMLNGLFLLAAAVLLFLFASKALSDERLGFVVGVAALLNYRVLEFSSMMMSEMSYLAFSALAIYLLYVISKNDLKGRAWWKNPNFYLLVLACGYAFQIRTQGVTLAAAVAVYFLFRRQWLRAGGFAAGFYLTTSIWTLRNALSGVGASRYIDQIIMVNQWRPEEGYISFSEVVTRGFETLQMLLTQAIPSTIMPYLNVDYAAKPSVGGWLAAILIISIIIIGFRRFGKFFPFFMAYTIFTLGIICLWSAPSENRYITTLVPILEMGLVAGVYHIILFCTRKIGVLNPLWLLLPIVILVAPKLRAQHEIAKAGYPPNYANFFNIATQIRGKLPADAVVCSRKPQLFYMFSKTYVCNYLFSLDDREVIKTLVDSKADYVVLDQLGYSSTERYLFPAIMKNQDLFVPVIHLSDPDTYLLKFDRERAKQKLAQ